MIFKSCFDSPFDLSLLLTISGCHCHSWWWIWLTMTLQSCLTKCSWKLSGKISLTSQMEAVPSDTSCLSYQKMRSVYFVRVLTFHQSYQESYIRVELFFYKINISLLSAGLRSTVALGPLSRKR